MNSSRNLTVLLLLSLLTACGGSDSETDGDSSSSAFSSSSSNASSDGDGSASSASSRSSEASQSSDSQSSSSDGNTADRMSCEEANQVRGFAAMGEGTTGGAGGDTVTVSTGTELSDALANKGNRPLTIYVDGTITPEGIAEGKFNIKDMSDVSIIGVGDQALFDGIGIKIRRASNIIIRNITMRYVDIGDKDHISMEGPADHIWIDHNTFYNSLDVGKDYYDELVSGKRDVDNITLSYNVLRDSWKTSLWGSSDSDSSHRRVTFHGNHWSNVNSRLPLYRFGESHIVNNLYQDVHSTAINSRMGATIRIEGNVFEAVKNPIVAFYSEEIGYWDVEDNLYSNVTWSEGDGVTAGPGVESTVSYTPAYEYERLPAEQTKAHVLSNAGAGRIGDCL